MISVSDLQKLLGNLNPSEIVKSVDKDLVKETITIVTEDNSYIFTMFDIEKQQYAKFTTTSWTRKCNCGAEYVDSKYHSTWCALYNYGF